MRGDPPSRIFLRGELMAEKRICLCCGKEYEYCPNCGGSKTPWKVNYDTEACKELFNIVSAYNMNLVNEDKVKEVLDKHSITDFSVYKDSIRNLLNKLFTKQKVHEPVVETPKEEIPSVQIEQETKEESSVELEETPVVQEDHIFEAPRNNRRRNRFFE